MEQMTGGIRGRNSATYPLTHQEIAVVNCSGGAAPTKYIVETLAKWNLLKCGLVLNVLKTEGHCYDWTKNHYIYLLPEDGDQLVQDLADLSLTHNIIALKYEDYEYNVFFEESKDGSTNIDAETIEAFRRTFKED
jgi:hypothetical protein